LIVFRQIKRRKWTSKDVDEQSRDRLSRSSVEVLVMSLERRTKHVKYLARQQGNTCKRNTKKTPTFLHTEDWYIHKMNRFINGYANKSIYFYVI